MTSLLPPRYGGTYPNLYSYHAMVKGRQVGSNQRLVGPNQRLVAQPEGFIDCKSYHFVVYGIREPLVVSC